jgi:hypothetical protein
MSERRFVFTVEMVGYAENVDDAWEEARDYFMSNVEAQEYFDVRDEGMED